MHPDHHGRGIGRRLLDALITSTEAAGVWPIQSGIFPENTASLALHRAAGFRAVGTHERLGRHHGVWRDVTLVERRSPNLKDGYDGAAPSSAMKSRVPEQSQRAVTAPPIRLAAASRCSGVAESASTANGGSRSYSMASCSARATSSPWICAASRSAR